VRQLLLLGGASRCWVSCIYFDPNPSLARAYRFYAARGYLCRELELGISMSDASRISSNPGLDHFLSGGGELGRLIRA